MFYFDGSVEPKEWRTGDVGFEEVLLAHIEKRIGKPITEAHFKEIIEQVRYWEKSFYEATFNFDPELLKKAEKACRSLGIEGFSPGEGGA